MRSPFRQLMNQHSYVLIVIGAFIVVLLVGLLFNRRIRLALAGALCAASVVVFAWLRTGPGDVRAVSDLDAALTSGGPTVLELYSDYCFGCLSAKPAYDDLAREFAGRATFLRVDVQSGAGRELATRHHVDTVPTFLAFDSGARLMDAFEGNPGVPVTELRTTLSRAIE